MRIIILLGAMLAWAVPGTEIAAFGQFSPTATRYGMFGPRALGGPIAPKPGRFRGGLEIGPSGTFEGIRHTYPWLQKDDIGPVSPAWSVWRDTPLFPTNEILPAPYDLESTLRVISPEPTTPAGPPTPPPAPASPPAAPTETAAPPVAETPEFPLRRAGDGLPGGTAEPQQASAPRQTGPAAVSPFQTAGAPYTTFRAGFEVNRPTVDRTGARLSRQLTASPRIERLSPIQVQVQGQTAILRGAVASDYDRRVAEQVVRMEAGIRDVRNELTVPRPAGDGRKD
ncbi:MAG: BON domain-containing protein [Pirellulales bacterium]|nr:BON domain-containing protein [Pirellulales bacterium]